MSKIKEHYHEEIIELQLAEDNLFEIAKKQTIKATLRDSVLRGRLD